MLHDIVKKNATDRSVTVKIVDSTDGTPETGVVFNTSGIDLWYRREGAELVSITEATLASLTTAHSDGGFLHVGNGVYRLDLPDAAFATGANYVDFGGTVTGMVVIGGRVRLTNMDIEDSVRLGLTALPNAAADAAGGLPISDAGGLDLDALPTSVWAVTTRTLTDSAGIKKNTALSNFEFFMVDSLDHVSGMTGLTVTAQRSIDGGAFAACTNSVTEASAGVYKLNLSTTDLNGTIITLKMTATGADATLITIKTAP